MKACTLLLAPALVSLVACGPKAHFTSTSSAPRTTQPLSPEDVEIYSASLPKRDFTETGIIEVKERISTNTLSEMIAAMRGLAAKKGCDALKLGGSVDRVEGAGFVYNGTGASSTTTVKRYWATCLAYTSTPVASR